MTTNQRLFRGERAAEFAFLCCFAIFVALVYRTFFSDLPVEEHSNTVSFITSETETAVITSEVETNKP